MTSTDAQIEVAADALIDHVVPFPLEGADTIEMSGMYSYDELKAIAGAAITPVLAGIEEKIEALRAAAIDTATRSMMGAVFGSQWDVESQQRAHAKAKARYKALGEALAIIRGETP